MISYSQLWSIQEPILAMCLVVEGYIRYSGKMATWRDLSANWWTNLQLIKWKNRAVINRRFLRLYNAVYGEQLFSVRRLSSVTISSLIFTFLFYIFFTRLTILHGMPDYIPISNGYFLNFFNYYETGIEKQHPLFILAVLFDSLGINVLPDFLSVAETGWILKKATKNNSNILGLFLLDLLLTTLICFFSHIVAYLCTAFIIPGNIRYLSMDIVKYNYSIYNGIGVSKLAFILTTYITSFFWLCFVCSVLFFGLAKRISKFSVLILESKLAQKLPLSLIVGIPCLLSWPVLFLLNIIS